MSPDRFEIPLSSEGKLRPFRSDLRCQMSMDGIYMHKGIQQMHQGPGELL